MNTNLYIPTKIKVGFQERSDTFTGKLGFLTFYNESNILNKQKSWEKWCNKSFEPYEFDNTPSKFIINKNITRTGYYNSGRTLARIYDNRGFEFEITMDNLLFILMHSDISKRDIIQECVYAWDKNQLVLLPTNALEYQTAITFTQKKNLQISETDLVAGNVYVSRNEDKLYLYIGKYKLYKTTENYVYNIGQKYVGIKHIFYDLTTKNFKHINFESLSSCVSEKYENFSTVLELFENSNYNNKIISLNTEKIDVNISRKDYYNKLLENNCESMLNERCDYEMYILGDNFFKILDKKLYHISFNNIKNNISNISIEVFNIEFNKVSFCLLDKGYGTLYPHLYNKCLDYDDLEIVRLFNLDFLNRKSLTVSELINFLFDNGYKNSLTYTYENNKINNCTIY